ncbi:MAG: hypothetical protein FF85_02320 [alpha proteobacterium QL1]|nr:MAG: hypothetical protein FF85_02320 [alpha proteobacterium QL1]
MTLQKNLQQPVDPKVSEQNDVIDFKNYKNFKPRPQSSIRRKVNLHDLMQKNIDANKEENKNKTIIYSSVAGFIATIFLIGLI